jgi:hypothetical protein
MFGEQPFHWDLPVMSTGRPDYRPFRPSQLLRRSRHCRSTTAPYGPKAKNELAQKHSEGRVTGIQALAYVVDRDSRLL